VKTSFLGGFYESRAKPVSAQTCVNLYLESNESGTGEEGALLGTPGLVRKAQLATGEVRGLREVQGLLFAVSGSAVYRIDQNFSAFKIGDIPNYSGPVSITDNGTQVLFSHQDGWHFCTLTSLLKAVSDPDQPINAIVTEQDGTVLFTDGGARFGITALEDLTSVDPLDFASAEGAPDQLISLVCDHREVWLLCKFVAEIWSDTGNALFPFERIPGGMLETGCAARFSVTRADDSVWWLTQDRQGNANVIRTNAYRPLRVSTHPIEHTFEDFPRVDDCIAFAYQQEGHTFIVFTFPTADETWVYDVATQLWHRRAWLGADGKLHRHRANCYAFFNGQHIVGDFENGKLYAFDLDAFSDDGDVIYRERAWMLPDSERHRVRLDRLELVAEMGVGNIIDPDAIPQVWLEVSHDGGESFGYRRFQTLGKLGKRLARAQWRRLGVGRQTVLRVCTTALTKIAWLGANADAEVLG